MNSRLKAPPRRLPYDADNLGAGYRRVRRVAAYRSLALDDVILCELYFAANAAEYLTLVIPETRSILSQDIPKPGDLFDLCLSCNEEGYLEPNTLRCIRCTHDILCPSCRSSEFNPLDLPCDHPLHFANRWCDCDGDILTCPHCRLGFVQDDGTCLECGEVCPDERSHNEDIDGIALKL